MLTSIIRAALENRLLVLAAAVVLMVAGAWEAARLPIDVFPNLNRPRVVVMTEAHGLAPEEVETLITIPLETIFNGATNVQAVRTTSGIGMSIVFVEFDWGTDIYLCRQIVAERLAIVADRLPPEVKPQLMPISSIMGQIIVFGLVGDENTSDMELRTQADWVVRRELLTIEDVSQVIVMGGDRKQFQVLVDPDRLIQYGATLHEVKAALEASNQNTAGGYLDEQGPHELLVRSLGRIKSIDDLRQVVVKHRDGQSVRLEQVAEVVEGAQVKRGSTAAFTRDADSAGELGEMTGRSAVVLTVMKQPEADTRTVTDEVNEALQRMSLPPGVKVIPGLYEQKEFIDRAIDNVKEALRDGAILVLIVLFIFLVNVRTTLITLTAIPLSVLLTAIVFALFDMSVNTMTLGGLAVAIGELVDDAIVDVENIFRRLRENRVAGRPRHPLLVVFQASCEIRSSIVYGTVIVMLVFVPLFALSGMEGRLFTPLGIAYIVSIAASLLVSLTVTPVLSYWLLVRRKTDDDADEEVERDGFLLRGLKRIAEPTIAMSLSLAKPVILLAMVAVGIAAWGLSRLDRDFLPPFNEGAMQINALLPPGTSLATSTQVARQVEERLAAVDDIVAFVRKTGRAELDEHAEGVHVSEFVATINPETKKSRQELIQEIEDQLAEVPGIVVSVEQPLAHLISHMLSGVKAQVAIKLYGDELQILRSEAKKIEQAIDGADGVRNLQVEQQISIPQLRIEADSRKLAAFGLQRDDVNEFVETAMQGEVVSQVLQGQRTFDLVVRLGEEFREDREALERLQIDLPTGGSVKLEDVARIYDSYGPNSISRERAKRRIVVQCNVSGRGLVDVVDEIRRRLEPIEEALPVGYNIEYGGQFESQQSASRTISVLFVVSLAGMFLVLYKMFRSVNLALQVMVALPAAFIGSVAALYLTGQTLTVASMVGFISLCGIASRNGILLVNHYLHLVKYEGESWTREMVIRAGKDRLAPVLMTALTSGIGLVPLALSAGEPGKEILYPVATVIIGGLISCTLLEFLVRPALFWTLGIDAARRVVESNTDKVRLVEEGAGERGA